MHGQFFDAGNSAALRPSQAGYVPQRLVLHFANKRYGGPLGSSSLLRVPLQESRLRSSAPPRRYSIQSALLAARDESMFLPS